MIYIYHHIGLGDHFICNAIVRHYNEKYNGVRLFCKINNIATVSFMYRDISNIELIAVNNDDDVRNYIQKFQIPLKIIGFNNWGTETFDETFYLMAGIPFNKRWDSFHIDRNYENEQKIIEHYKVVNKSFIFVHDDESRGYKINNNFLNNKIVVRPIIGVTTNICDYLGIIEMAEEIHCIDSSFRCMIDSIFINKVNKYFHYYARKPPLWETPKSKNWVTYG